MQYPFARGCDPLSTIHLLVLVDPLDFGGKLAPAKLGADLIAGFELREKFYQTAILIEYQRITARQNGLGRKAVQAAVQTLPPRTPPQQHGLGGPRQRRRQLL